MVNCTEISGMLLIPPQAKQELAPDIGNPGKDLAPFVNDDDGAVMEVVAV